MALLAAPGASYLISGVAGIAGYAAENMLMSAAGSGGSGIFGVLSKVTSTATSAITTIVGFFSGDWVWWLGSAGVGIVAGIVGTTLTGGAIFPIVASFAAGFGLRFIKDDVLSELQ
jgi:hypothetical protein